ncbi:hypothetical protein P3X46_002999 [Hevea brasiliensis]|uniref:Thioredoxin domain-containing protein n=1 Tax=Hevea brasiliensis TaxID=3981 RepID=A0ABQ9N794_HEVBR|nr:thioredoxin H7 [Hevea brasiliensis]KAJ9187557.1 hypothetical protein P3X46_002999 [Hevea brasiliensis]
MFATSRLRNLESYSLKAAQNFSHVQLYIKPWDQVFVIKQLHFLLNFRNKLKTAYIYTSSMEFGFPVLRRGRTMSSRFSFNHYIEFSDTKTSAAVVEIHSTDQWKAYFDASKGNNKLLVIQFTATWCGPCRFIDPAIKEFAAKYTDVDFIKIDVDKLVMVAMQFEANTLPAFALMKKGKQVDKIVGVKKLELQNKIEQYRV